MSSTDWERGVALGSALSTAVVLFHQAVAEQLGLGVTEWKCLDVLRQAGPLAAGQVAERTGLTTGAVTGIVDRLERAGRVRRVSDVHDRRRVIIERAADPDFEQQVAGIFGSLGQGMAAVLAQFTDQERQVVARYLEHTIALLTSETARLRQEP